MEELFNILSSSARIDKSKRRKVNNTNTNRLKNQEGNSSAIRPATADEEEPDEADDATNDISHDTTGTGDAVVMKSRDRTGKRDTSESKLQQVHIEEVAAFRRSMNIRLRYNKNYYDVTNLADPISSFPEITCPPWWNIHTTPTNGDCKDASKPQQQQHLQLHFQNLHRAIQQNIELGRWTEPTPIQMQLIPLLLHNRYDCIACAPTGSGKSGAFIIPALYICSTPHSVFYNHYNNNNNHHHETNSLTSSHSANGRPKKKSPHKLTEALSQAGEIRVLIIAPSYELASQLHRETERIGTGKPGGNTCILLSKSNVTGLIQKTIGGKNGVDIVITTPLRLCDAIQKGLSINTVRFIVLDEADRLLDATDGSTATNSKTNGSSDSDDDDDDDDIVESTTLSNNQSSQSGTGQSQTFLSQMDLILSCLPATAIRALFSATVTTHVRQLSESILRNPMDVTITANLGNNNENGGSNHYSGTNPDIKQELMFVGREEGKLLAIRQLVARGQLRPPAIVFVQSQERAQALFAELLYDNIRIDVIHAGRSKAARETAVANFRKGETWVLICTDLVARGVDFRAVNMVINYDLPTTGVTYIHRIGRTGRAGRKGTAITLFTEMDFDNLRMIANVMKQSGCTVPDWMLNLKKARATSAKHRIAPRRPDIDTTPSYDKKKLHKKQQVIKHNQQKKKHKSVDNEALVKK